MIDQPAFLARPVPAGVPVLEQDALTLLVDPTPAVGEFGAISFARDIAVWLARIFDRPVERAVYRENPWDHRDCPRAQSYEFTIAGHTILITAYEQGPTSTGFAHAISVDGRPIKYAPHPDPRPRHQAWHLAWHAWRAAR